MLQSIWLLPITNCELLRDVFHLPNNNCELLFAFGVCHAPIAKCCLALVFCGKNQAVIPLASQQGGEGCVIKKNSRSHRRRRSRAGFPFLLIRKTTPASRSSDAARHFMDRSATPVCSDARRRNYAGPNVWTLQFPAEETTSGDVVSRSSTDKLHEIARIVARGKYGNA